MRTFQYNDAQWKLIYELYCYGYSASELGEWLGISKEAVWYNFRVHGFKASGDYRVPLSHYTDQLNKLGLENRNG